MAVWMLCLIMAQEQTKPKRKSLKSLCKRHLDRLRWFENPLCVVPRTEIESEKEHILWDIRQLALAAGKPDIARECSKPGNTADMVCGFVAQLDAQVPFMMPADGAPLTVKQAGKLLNLPTSTVYDLCAKGILPHRRHGTKRGTIRIARQAIENYMRQSR
jgi:excisionase family DNA binding protein